MAADTRQDDSAAKQQLQRHISFSEFDDDEEALAAALEAEVTKLSPEKRKAIREETERYRIKYYLTGKRKEGAEDETDQRAAIGQSARREEVQMAPPTALGPDPLKNGTYDDDDEEFDEAAKAIDEKARQEHADRQAYMASEAYKPNTFGDFRSYMQNKRLKLKVQEKSIADATPGGEPTESLPCLFPGTNVYINGHTNPPYAELRRLIHLYGGELMPYLDTKSPVTHIIASNLTAKKRIEFAQYKVVRPQWITESIAQGRRLDWRDYRCGEDAAGTMSMGALAGRSKVGATGLERERERHQAMEDARAAAARADWRNMGAQSTSGGQSDAAGQVLLSYAQSGAGAGAINGVGPWGKASRQRTLGGWADKRPATDGDALLTANRTKSKAEARSNDSEELSRAPPQTAPTVSVSKQITAEDEQWPDEPARKKVSMAPPVKVEPRTPSKQSTASEIDLVTPPRKSPVQDAHVDEASGSRPSEEAARTFLTPTRKSPAKPDDKVFSNLGTDPPTEAAAVAAGLRDPKHPYASRPSNSKAAQLMASPSWRERNTATSEGFLQGYFTKSRLHHLSTWKSEMKEMVGQALREAKREQGSVDLPSGLHRVIFHVDFDAFFVSVGLRSRPDLRDKAVVVCHATDGADTAGVASTSEIASCNYVARKHGIRNGMSLGQARRYCASVATIPYDFMAYNDIAVQFYTLLLSHADAIEAVSIDEALIDVSFLLDEMRRGVKGDGTVGDGDEADIAAAARLELLSAYRDQLSSQGEHWSEEKQLAEALRDEIRKRTGCEASIGIGSNVLLARLATREAKPGGSFHLRDEKVAVFVDAMDVDDLHGVGWSIRNRCNDVFGTFNVGELKAVASRAKFVAQFGEKHGVTIWDKLHGRERDKLESVKMRQSCGASVNYAIRFQTDEEVKTFVHRLALEVSSRLKAISMSGRVCCVSLMVRSKDAPVEASKFLGHGICDTFNRSATLARLTDDGEAIYAAAWKLFAALHVQPDQMRGLGVSLQKLESNEGGPVVGTREAGQSMLSFAKIPSAAAKEVEAAPSEQQKGSDEQNEYPPRTVLPPSTQFVVPPASQVDPTVLAALPHAIRDQIMRGQQSTKAADMTRASSAPGVNERDSAPRQASPFVVEPVVTPKRANKRKVIDPFERMRAASVTPTKKQKSYGKAVTTPTAPASAPSTPSGSQRRAQAATWEPTWSQIDPAVMAELPESVRKDIMRQFGGGGASTSTIVRDDGLSASSSPLRRAQSLTPSKKQAFLDVYGVRGGQKDRPRVAETSAGPVVCGSVLTKADAVTREELKALDIDADVFAALPSSMQQEMLEHQRHTFADRKALFRAGKHSEDLTRAQQRIAMREQAFPAHDKTHSGPPRAIDSDGGGERPLTTIKGAHTTGEVCALIGAWVNHSAPMSGPRQRDVQRFARFLLDSLERRTGRGGGGGGGDNGRAAQQQSTRQSSRRPAASTSTEEKEGGKVATLDGLEKVQGVLRWWVHVLQRVSWNESASMKEMDVVEQAWWDALHDVHAQVNEVVKRLFGARLSIGRRRA